MKGVYLEATEVEWKHGDIGILVERRALNRAKPSRDTSRMLMHEAPLTNMSRQPRESGWCGTTNNVSVTALGPHRVVRFRGWANDGIHRLADIEEVKS